MEGQRSKLKPVRYVIVLLPLLIIAIVIKHSLNAASDQSYSWKFNSSRSFVNNSVRSFADKYYSDFAYNEMYAEASSLDTFYVFKKGSTGVVMVFTSEPAVVNIKDPRGSTDKSIKEQDSYLSQDLDDVGAVLYYSPTNGSDTIEWSMETSKGDHKAHHVMNLDSAEVKLNELYVSCDGKKWNYRFVFGKSICTRISRVIFDSKCYLCVELVGSNKDCDQSN